jgi:hypothetical protein
MTRLAVLLKDANDLAIERRCVRRRHRAVTRAEERDRKEGEKQDRFLAHADSSEYVLNQRNVFFSASPRLRVNPSPVDFQHRG